MIDQGTVIQFLRNNLLGYAAVQFPEFKVSRHHKFLADKLEQVERGEIKRLCVLMPPRHGKSKLTTELFASWYLGRDPKRRILSLSYNQDLSDTFGRSVRNYLKTPNFESLFPVCKLASDSNSIRKFSLTAGGSYSAIGAGAGITGRGGDLLLLDDLVKDRQEADSATYRENLINWYKSVARTRLQPGGAIVICQTRWGTNDFIAWLLSETAHENWHVINLPAIAIEGDLLGRQINEALWPECYSAQDLEAIRTTLGSRDWNALYQQMPLSDSDVIFRRDWLQFYADSPRCENYLQSWDLSFGGSGASNSWVCGQVWGWTGNQKYLLHMVREQTGFSGALDLIRQTYQRYPTAKILVENKANGPGAIETLRMELGHRVVAVNPRGGKEDRAYGILGQFERGEVWLANPQFHPWIDPLLREIDSFPQSNSDDCVDSMTQALRWIDLSSRQRQLVPSQVSFWTG